MPGPGLRKSNLESRNPFPSILDTMTVNETKNRVIKYS